MRLFFVYDTAHCKADHDDPKDAVIYFFPSQAFENQHYSLCCQLVGVAKFLRSSFSSPSIIALDQGKFSFHWSGKYLLVLGGAPNIHGNVLKRHLAFLCGIFCFYHGSINTLLKECRYQRQEFLARMEMAWSRYITLFQCFNNLLHLSLNAVPLANFKTYVAAVSKASQLLRMCQLSSSVIAGTVFCNGRVLSSQLMPELTSFLTLMSNANASSPVSNVSDVHVLPPDVELKYVYLSQKAIKNIMKYNHIYVGSHIRVKSDVKTQSRRSYSFPQCDNVSSGSEGDVDSGNCSESVRGFSYHDSKADIYKRMNSSHLPKKLLPHKRHVLCCATHSALHKRNLFLSRNHNCAKILSHSVSQSNGVIAEDNISVHRPLYLQSEISHVGEENASKNSQYFGISLLCNQHAYLLAVKFLTKMEPNHLNLVSSCDLEFSCSLCDNHNFTLPINSITLKTWNSEVNIPDFMHRVPLSSMSFSKTIDFHNTSTHKKQKKEKETKVSKIQILKCRSKSDNFSHLRVKHSLMSHHYAKKNVNEDSGFDSKERKSKVFSFSSDLCDKKKISITLESNDLQKTVLYVQRCGSNTVLLLLNQSYDSKILTYLWNCIFSILKDLDFESEKKVQHYGEIDPSYYILLYNNSQKVLKEYPYPHGSVFVEKSIKDSIQTIQEDFESDPNLHMICLLTSNQDIFACHTKQHTAFYLQPETTGKIESLCSLSKRALRRLEKYMKIPL